MTFKDDLYAASKKIFSDQWTTTEKRVVPSPGDLGLGNDAGRFEEMTILYADLDGSTCMVDTCRWTFSAEVYKAYLHCAAKIVKAQGGFITAYDGDRIMAVFTGDSKNTNAVKAALKINAAISQVINPALRSYYTDSTFFVKHSVGIDTSEIHVARIGVRGDGDNDLVWVGRAANHAAKLTTLADDGHPLWISEAVYERMNDSLKAFPSGWPAWEPRLWTKMNNATVYRSNGTYSLD
jgi:class 3 adenylate cyclase